MRPGSDVRCTPRWVDLDPGRSTYYVPRVVVAFPIQIQSRSAWPMHTYVCVYAGPAGARYGVPACPVRKTTPPPAILDLRQSSRQSASFSSSVWIE
jgi:hypothetical protein